MSAPRASRKGGKVATATSPATSAADSPAVAPAAATDTPAEGTDNSMLPPPAEATTPSSEPAKLPDPPAIEASDSLLQLPTDISDVIAVGTVRGRGHTSSMQRRTATADKDGTGKRMESAVSEIAAALKKGGATAWLDRKPPTATLSQLDVAVVSDSELLRLPLKVIQENADAKILMIVPKLPFAQTLCETINGATKSSTTARLWSGSNYHGAPSTRILTTDEATALTFLAQTKGCKPFTHIVVGKAHSSTVTLQTLLFTLRRILSDEPAKKRTKVIVSGFGLDAVALGKYFDPLKAWPVQSDKPAFAVTELTQDEAFALAEAEIAVATVRSTDARAATPHPKVSEAAQTATVSLVKKVLASAESAGTPISVLVITGEISDTVYQLRSQGFKKCNVTTSVPTLVGAAAGKNAGFSHITVVPRAINEGDAADANISVVIDHGTERAFFPSTTAGEATLPSKRTQWQSAPEQVLRLRTLGWNSPGLYIPLWGAADQKNFPAKSPALTSILPSDEGILVAARNGITFPEANESLAIPLPEGNVEDSMQRLSEVCATVSASNTAVTFLGEMLSRLPVGVELASFVSQAAALGLTEIACIVASVATVPLRSQAPSSATNREAWGKTVEASRKANAVGRNDLFADAKVYLLWAAKDSQEAKTAFAAENGVDEALLAQVENTALSLQDQLSNFVFFDSSVAPIALLESLEGNANALTMLLAVAFTRRAIVVRNEGAIGNASASGNLLCIRSPKEVVVNQFTHTNSEWKLGSIVIAINITNGFSKMYASDCLSIPTNVFFAAHMLLNPCLDYSAPERRDRKQSIMFSFSVSRSIKRLRVDVADGANILDFREQWNQALGCMQARRCLPVNTTRAQFALHLKSSAENSVQQGMLQQTLLKTLVTLPGELEVVEHQQTFQVFNTNRLTPAFVGAAINTPAEAADIVIAQRLAKEGLFDAKTAVHVDPATAAPAASASPAAAAANDDDVEDESMAARFHSTGGPVLEDDDVEDEGGPMGAWRSGPIIEDDDDE